MSYGDLTETFRAILADAVDELDEIRRDLLDGSVSGKYRLVKPIDASSDEPMAIALQPYRTILGGTIKPSRLRSDEFADAIDELNENWSHVFEALSTQYGDESVIDPLRDAQAAANRHFAHSLAMRVPKPKGRPSNALVGFEEELQKVSDAWRDSTKKPSGKIGAADDSLIKQAGLEWIAAQTAVDENTATRAAARVIANYKLGNGKTTVQIIAKKRSLAQHFRRHDPRLKKLLAKKKR